MLNHPLAGVYAAAITPLNEDGSPDLDLLPAYLDFLARRGLHGVLLLGTTGEGPSFAPEERRALWESATEVRQKHPAFRLMAGTGTPSLTETIALNQAAFGLGCEAVVVLPPYYYRNAGDDGLFAWYAEVIEKSVPGDRLLLGYHIPAVSGVGLSLSLLERLAAAYPNRFGGLKDSSGDLEHAKTLAARLKGKLVLVGNDKLLAPALAGGASGGITALANLEAPVLRAIWDAHLAGEDTAPRQAELDRRRAVMDSHPPATAFLKAMLHEEHGFPRWPLRPPLRAFTADETRAALAEWQAAQT